MSERLSDSAGPTWRSIAKKTAYQATIREARNRWTVKVPQFNYRWEHVQVVVRLSKWLAKSTGADLEIVEAAAWLHDAQKQGRFDNHGEEGARAAKRLLTGTDFPPEKINAVAHAIAQHVGLATTEPIEPLEAAILWDADKLSKLGATAVLHFAGNRFLKGTATTEQLLDYLRVQPWQPEVVRCLHTEPARRAGEQRLRTYRQFWEQATQEFDGSDLTTIGE